ncbi:unnamed protein product [Schistosoma rodhaini]|nr:unnamed protein product [Schistosoma rodhaini]
MKKEMYSTQGIQRFNYHSIYYHLFTLLILIYSIDQIHGQYDFNKWRNDQDDISYIPLNKMTLNSLFNHNNNHNHNNNNNDIRKIIKTRAVEIVPPERPFIFETPEALRTYLHKLNEYFAIIGRPRFGRR